MVGDGRCGPRAGRAQRCPRWFRAVARCRSETGAPGAALVRGWRCAMRQSRWEGAASSALVSRCRAMPVGDRRSRRRACSRLAMRDAAVTLAWRSVVGAGFALSRDAGRRPALQAPRLFAVGDARCGSHAGWRSRRRAWRLAMRDAAVVVRAGFALSRDAGRSVVGAGFALSRDAGRRPALQPRACSRLAMRDAAVALGGRSVVGAGFALSRDAGRRPALQAPRLFAVGDARCGSHVGMAQCRRRWFRAVARCRSETGAPAPRLFAVGDARCGSRVGRAQRRRRWFRAAARCRSETGAPGPRLFAVGDARCGSHVGRAQRRRRWFRAAARCRSETGAPGPALVRGWRWAMRQSRWHGAVSSALVSRCRAMPVGDRRSSPALVRGWRWAVSRRCAPRCRSEDRRCLRFRRRGRRVRKGPRPRSREECWRRRPRGRQPPDRPSRPAGGWRS